MEVLGLHVHQSGPGEGHVVLDGRLGHGPMHQPVLGRHLLAHRGTEGAAASPAAWAPASAHPGAPPPPNFQRPCPTPSRAQGLGPPVPALVGIAPDVGTQGPGTLNSPPELTRTAGFERLCSCPSRPRPRSRPGPAPQLSGHLRAAAWPVPRDSCPPPCPHLGRLLGQAQLGQAVVGSPGGLQQEALEDTLLGLGVHELLQHGQ